MKVFSTVNGRHACIVPQGARAMDFHLRSWPQCMHTHKHAHTQARHCANAHGWTHTCAHTQLARYYINGVAPNTRIVKTSNASSCAAVNNAIQCAFLGGWAFFLFTAKRTEIIGTGQSLKWLTPPDVPQHIPPHARAPETHVLADETSGCARACQV